MVESKTREGQVSPAYLEKRSLLLIKIRNRLYLQKVVLFKDLPSEDKITV
jgi:hypothetical protein